MSRCGEVRGVVTGIPKVWIFESCVGENIRWPPSLAAVKRFATRADRFSERPNCIL